MFTAWLRRVFSGAIEAGASFFDRLGLHPNGLTLIGCLLQVSVGFVLALGALRLGGVLLMFTSIFDAFDGALARRRGQASRFGAFLDSCLDRVSESALLLGLGWYYMGQPGRLEEILVYVAIVGSLMVSYTRARAEGLGVECKVGLMTRVERTLVLFLGLLTGWVLPALWILSVGSVLTAVHRMIDVYQKMRGMPLANE